MKKYTNETIKMDSTEIIEMCKDDFIDLVNGAFAHAYSVEKPLEQCVYPKFKMAQLDGRISFLGEFFDEFPTIYDFAKDYAEQWEKDNDGTKEEWLEWFKKAFFFDRETLLDRK